MIIKAHSPRRSLNKAFRKVTTSRQEFDLFKYNLKHLISNIDLEESEENVKNHLKDFLNHTYYKGKHLLNSKHKTDLVIYLENKQDSKAGVLFEVKRPSNKSEMITKKNLNAKALHELILYYLRERMEKKNDEIKYLIATNIYEWFIFDATLFETLFCKNNNFIKDYNSWKTDKKVSSKTDHFYNEIITPFLDKINADINFTHFDLTDYQKLFNKNDKESEKKLIPLYKLLSPIHFLKQSFTNDSNSLDRNFYNELLHIIGLEEVKVKSKKIIRRKENGTRDPGSIIENTIQILKTDNAITRITDPIKFGDEEEEQLYSIALELSLTWINRILFLKLLESQLHNYHKSDGYKFLNSKVIIDFDELYKLFHQVLAIKNSERTNEIKKKFNLIPYLNSSLFEITELENEAIRINGLDDNSTLQFFKSTIFKDKTGKRIKGELPVLHYLFKFLDAYNFTSEGKEEIEDDKKTLINASVLGLIFEKINGYKDGSYFTPGFITMYMSRESIRRAVVQKFNEKFNWECESSDDLHNHLADKKNTADILEANSVINSLKICDPAVGSGHFLVSALNEIITIKSELGILADEKGKILKGYEARVENDDLIVSFDAGEEIFEYRPPVRESGNIQRVQETLFREKQTIIENCLFGVDINPNSVKIAQLRLWIELLKNAYYTSESNYEELETLPNIDINIKEGNSLISRFDIKDDYSHLPIVTKQKIKLATAKYKDQVLTYKATDDRNTRTQAEKNIKELKKEFGQIANPNDKTYRRLRELESNLMEEVLHFSRGEKEEWEKKRIKLEKEYGELKNEYITKQKTIYGNAFEWRFEFPEVLNDDGDFVGFDVIIGNPPYFQIQKLEIDYSVIKTRYLTYEQTGDIYILFYELGSFLLSTYGILSYITSNKWLRANYGSSFRNFLIKNTSCNLLIDFNFYKVFAEASVDTNILEFKKGSDNSIENAVLIKEDFKIQEIDEYIQNHSMKLENLNEQYWNIVSGEKRKLNQKLQNKGKRLKDWAIEFNRGILTGLNEAFIIDEPLKSELIKKDSKNSEIIVPYLRGRDICRFGYNYQHLWLIFTRRGINIDNYPTILEYLNNYKKKLTPRNKGEKTGRKPGPYEWFEIQDPIAYHDLFLMEKIIYAETMRIHRSDIANFPRFGYDNEGYFCDKTTFIATGKNIKYLLAILNSKVGNYLIREYITKLDTGGYMMQKVFLEEVPIIPPPQGEKLTQKIEQIINVKKKNILADTKVLEDEIDQMVYKLYGLTKEEIKIVEESVGS